ncbi:CoA transferase [Amycolatopsis rhizosphaerae]|uniref:CoA transferase n=1 Tax=Amycolatopsis rhizosphaerae TaxID=2053003 RepID=A0A558DIT2_9PSEU|nr:CoA transferase [Amycolatopsis rhizosphaerae]TVT60926.1 CoA transferase [Amycolatopsis rhizosphaerae]
MSPLPLAGLRVLELGNYIAAPTAGRLLADFGAEVIKVERPGRGDEIRTWRLYRGRTSMLHRTLNRNKKSIELDLKSDEGRMTALKLAAGCDVVLENFRPGTLESWGLGPEELDDARPGIVVVRVSAYGQNGPLSGEPGFAAVAEAVGGLRALVGEPDRPPARTGVSIGDTLAGIYGAFGAVIVLLGRARDPRAPVPPLADRIIDVALNEAVLSVTESLVPDHLAYGVERRRTGGRVEGIAPSNAYRCQDGSSVVVAGNGDAIFRRFMAAIGRPDLAERPDLQDNSARWANVDELDAAIEEWSSGRPRDEVLATLAKAGVPAGPISTAADIIADAQYAARDMIQYFGVDTGDGVHRVGFPGIVPVIGDRSLPIRSLGPGLGEHTAEILGERP